MKANAWYVGCACDRNFVQHTSIMLTSLAENGCVPEATILIAGFDLEAVDYDRLRAGAGPFGAKVRFVDVTPDMLGKVAERQWESHYSLPIFGRYFLYDAIRESGARILTLDSDMIVNSSVRPLFELNMLGDYVAATHDVPRTEDPSYFNSGMMMVDVDVYRHYKVSQRCLEWLAQQDHRPRWPDQDALNHIVGHRWFRLDKTWNRNFCGHEFDPEPLTPAFYEKAAIAHFTGQTKPWNDAGHAGRALYERYLATFRRNREVYLAVKNHVDTNFLFTAFELLLGRSPSSSVELLPLRRLSARNAIRAIVHTPEFAAHTLLPLKLGVDFPAGTYSGAPTERHRAFAAERILLHPSTAEQVGETTGWRDVLLTLTSDPFFQAGYGLEPMVALAQAARTMVEIRTESVTK